jgi:hypothetical protein
MMGIATTTGQRMATCFGVSGLDVEVTALATMGAENIAGLGFEFIIIIIFSLLEP